MTAALKALAALQQRVAGQGGSSATDWALTLHMLEHLAPAFFQAQRLRAELDAALVAIESLPAEFPPGLDVDEAMARVDASYLRTVRGLSAKPLDGASFTRWIEQGAVEFPLHGWLMIELARECGVAHPQVLPSRYPFKATAPIAHLYLLTHEVMIDSRYFARPCMLADGARIYDELEAALPWCIAERHWDLAAELAFTLRFAGRAMPAAIAALEVAQRPNGEMSVEGPDRERTHAVATALIAFASSGV